MTMLKYPYTGLGQFSLYLGRELLQNNPENYAYNFLLYPSRQDFFAELAYQPQYMHLPKRLLAKNRMPYTQARCNLWHILSQNSHYFPYNTHKPIIYTIHDLNFLREDSPAKAEKRHKILQQQLDLTTQITAISNYAAEDVKAHFDLKGKSIEVVHNGVAIAHFPNAPRPTFLSEGLPFIFTVGAITPRKNFHTLVEMMRFLPDMRLVVAGKKDDAQYIQKIEQIIAENNLQERVILPDTIKEEEKYWLYKNCEAFAFPSLLEGFGMPIIEALSVGKPVFASTATSLPEVGGDITRYWTDFQPDKMATFFQQALQEIKQDSNFVSKALAQAQLFTWKRACNHYKSLYKKLI